MILIVLTNNGKFCIFFVNTGHGPLKSFDFRGLFSYSFLILYLLQCRFCGPVKIYAQNCLQAPAE